jgi:hypothetical protein
MPTTSTEQPVKWLWIMGIVVWFLVIALLWRQLYGAQTFAQASLNSTRLSFVSAIGIFWSLAGAFWLARLKRRGKPNLLKRVK